ncbi:hypothetical protein [Cysteiniphilum sp. 6C5]
MGNIFSLLLLTVLSLPVIGNACDHYDPFGDRPADNSAVDDSN